MSVKEKAELAAYGQGLSLMIDAAITKQIELISTSFEVLATLSPNHALDVVNQLKVQISTEAMKDLDDKQKSYHSKTVKKLLESWGEL
jgi:hypothetical protein